MWRWNVYVAVRVYRWLFSDVGRHSIHLKNFGDRAKNLSPWSGKLSTKFHAIKIRHLHELGRTLWAKSMSANMSGRPPGPSIVYKPRRINIEWKNSNKNPINPSNKIHAKFCLSECLFSLHHPGFWLVGKEPMRATISLYSTTTCHATMIKYAKNNSLAKIAK